VTRSSAQRRALAQRLTFPFLIVAAAAMIILSRADFATVQSLRASVGDAAAPALELLSRPLAAGTAVVARVRDAVALYRENARLEEENERLLSWQQAALRLAAENTRLRDLLKLTPPASVSFVTARVIANSGGAYLRSVLIDAGSRNGIARGQAAITGEGLAGRVLETGKRTARVLLLSDLNSRVPVRIEPSGAQAVLAGDNSARPVLRYLPFEAKVRVGDRVVTSGDGGVFPPDLPIGLVAATDGGLSRVEPYVGLSELAFLRIVDYGLAGNLPKPVPAVRHAAMRH
jgi:rod shape-determining protein MreC